MKTDVIIGLASGKQERRTSCKMLRPDVTRCDPMSSNNVSLYDTLFDVVRSLERINKSLNNWFIYPVLDWHKAKIIFIHQAVFSLSFDLNWMGLHCWNYTGAGEGHGKMKQRDRTSSEIIRWCVQTLLPMYIENFNESELRFGLQNAYTYYYGQTRK